MLSAVVHLCLGEITAADADFRRNAEGLGLGAAAGAHWEVEGRLLRGDLAGARRLANAKRDSCLRDQLSNVACSVDALLTRLILPDDPTQATKHLHDARTFANRSGDVGLQLLCFHSACELQRHLGDHPQSIAEAEAGLLLADTCGFGKFSIDLRIALAETLLAAGDAKRALQNAREALDRSEHPDCQYAWGKADGLHFCGVAHLRLGERDLARMRLTAALEIRERISHGRIDETRRALELCVPKSPPPS
jgi:tetratricopeptide (TPR) repeat protein